MPHVHLYEIGRGIEAPVGMGMYASFGQFKVDTKGKEGWEGVILAF